MEKANHSRNYIRIIPSTLNTGSPLEEPQNPPREEMWWSTPKPPPVLQFCFGSKLVLVHALLFSCRRFSSTRAFSAIYPSNTLLRNRSSCQKLPSLPTISISCCCKGRSSQWSMMCRLGWDASHLRHHLLPRVWHFAYHAGAREYKDLYMLQLSLLYQTTMAEQQEGATSET